MSIRATCHWGLGEDACIIVDGEDLTKVYTLTGEIQIPMTRVQARKLARQLYNLADRCEWNEAKLKEKPNE